MQASPLTIAIGCFAAGSLAAVGIAQATSPPAKIPDSSTGVITSCVKKKGGAVRMVDAQAGKKCKKSERTVRFNQTGPAGAAGAPGERGERGPSDGFVKVKPAFETVSLSEPFLPGPETNSVIQLDLPAGQYIINAQTDVQATNDDTVNGFIGCYLTSADGSIQSPGASWRVTNKNFKQPIYVTGALSVTSAVRVYLTCSPADTAPFGFNGRGEASGGAITATKVADLTSG